MSGDVRVIRWGGGRRRTRVQKFLSHRDQQKRMVKWGPRARALRRKVKHREAFSLSFAEREVKKEEFPLSKREITCLKALNDLSHRGFTQVAIRDIARAAVRVYPVSFRMGLSEAQVLDCLEKMVQYKYVMGYSHLQPRHQKYRLTTKGKERLSRLDAELANAGEQSVIWVDGFTGRRSVSPSVPGRRVRIVSEQKARTSRTRIRRYGTWGY